MLLQFPEAGVVTADPAIRRIATTPLPYVIFYEATADEVITHAVRHGARAPYNSLGLHEDLIVYESGEIEDQPTTNLRAKL
jgi:hypothetical protein